MRYLGAVVTLTLAVAGYPGAAEVKAPSRLERLEARVADLESKAEMFDLRLRLIGQAEKTVVLDPTGSQTFQRMRAADGTFFVVLEDAQPYLDGVRVTLKIGNPTAATFAGFVLHARWGGREPDLAKDGTAVAWKAWSASLRSKDFPFTDHLRPGTWNKVSLIVSPVTPTDFGHLALSMETRSVMLTTE